MASYVKSRGTLIAFTLLLSLSVRGTCGTFYVSPTGSASGNGSLTSPWPSVTYALSKVSGPGTVIDMLPGIYRDPIDVQSTSAGTASAPLVIKSDSKWGATILSSPTYAIKTETGADYVTFDGIECAGALNVGVYLKGNYNTVRNCWVHNSGSVGIGAYTLTGTVLDSNLVEFNGQNPQFHHGIYADGTGLVIRDNIVRYNAALGMQLYPAISNSRIYNNLVYGHTHTGILVQSPTTSGGNNIVTNNTSVDNRTAIGMYNAYGEIVANNICKQSSGDPIYVSGSVLSDYNLCQPSSKYQGSHGLSADPQFVDPTHMCYWLLSTSPALSKATPQYAPTIDFWGLTVDNTRGPDIGAFAYHYSLTQTTFRSDWPRGYPDRFNLDPGNGQPNLWKSP